MSFKIGTDGMGADKALLHRILSALVLAPVMLYSIYLGKEVFIGITLCMAVLMAFEWVAMTKNKWRGLGIFYIVAPCSTLMWLIAQPQGRLIVMWLFLTIWISDTAAYFSGRIIGGPKLLPHISPKKTWAGLLGSLLVSLGWGMMFSFYVYSFYSKPLVMLTVVTAFLSQVGDFFESFIKRKCGVKDSSKLIPGHGGILDRMDGFTFAGPMVAIVLEICSKGFFP
jgi:phosphatidate cytidylyltransferase